jgi:hypothetical protein
MKTYGGIAPPFLTSALDRTEWSASRLGRFTPWEIAPGTHLIGWVGPRVGLDVLEKRKILICRKSNPGRPARRYPDSPVRSIYEKIL